MRRTGPLYASGVADPDPTYDAYLRALGFQQNTAQATADKRTADINARAGLEIPELGYQYGQNQEAVNTDALGRGVWSSGEHDRALAQAGHDYQYKLGSMEMTQAQSLGDVTLGLASTTAQIASDRAIAEARHKAVLQAAAEDQWNAALAAQAGYGSVNVPAYASSGGALPDPAHIFGADDPNSLRRGFS
jgi:hypothetical protein